MKNQQFIQHPKAGKGNQRNEQQPASTAVLPAEKRVHVTTPMWSEKQQTNQQTIRLNREENDGRDDIL